MTSKKTLTKTVTPTETKVLTHLMKAGEITGRDALLNMSIPNNTLAKCVFNLRMNGFKIATQFRRNPITGQRYAAYVMGA